MSELGESAVRRVVNFEAPLKKQCCQGRPFASGTKPAEWVRAGLRQLNLDVSPVACEILLRVPVDRANALNVSVYF